MKKFWPILVLLSIYLSVGLLYALNTPLWQAPDEPAHYNYVRSLAEGEGFPVMEAGDYDQDYLSRLTAEKFPDNLPIDNIEYEDHQPPLYYLLATPIFMITKGSVRALRIFSLLLGGVGVGCVLLILREYKPAQESLAWLGCGIIAFIPQFIAIMASINNDALVMALLWLWLWLALRYLRGKTNPLLLGGVLGALLLTKTTAYGALPLALLAIFLRYRREGQTLRWAAREAALIFGPALLLGGLWWLRNLMTYGWPDAMGLIQHNAVAMGQPTTREWIARDGAIPFLINAIGTTFRSFWGQFGWMGVVLDTRIYQGLALFTGLILWGSAWRLVESVKLGLKARQRDAMILLGSSALITLGLFLVYNITFVQHQGRYLFPALPTFALAAALGLNRVAERKLAFGTALFMLVAIVVLGISGLVIGDLPLWTMAIIGSAMLTLPASTFIPDPWRPLLNGGLLLALAALDLWCLFGFIVPALH